MFVFYVILSSIIVQCLGNTDSSVLTQCGQNEVFVECKTTCPPQDCNIAYTEYLCDPNPNPKCVPGCDCIKDYFRDDDKNCIYNGDCPYPTPLAICGEFEEPVISETSKRFNGNCKCINNYIRNSNGTCVPVVQEPTIECGFNEEPSTCKQTCPPQDCDFSYDKYACKPGPCQPGCNCIGTYLRNSSGICVPKDQCDSGICECGEFEEPVTNETDKDITSFDGNCKCIDNYIRNSNGTCVPVVQEPTIECGINEEPSTCKQTCPPQSCSFSYKKYACKAGPCQPGCNCIGTYLRNSSGICVPKDQCDSDPDEDCEPEIVKAKAPSSSLSVSSHAHASSSIKSNTANVPSNPTGEIPCIYDQCTPTCFLPNPSKCPQTSNPCNCSLGYILFEKGGQCVKLEECQNCDGDRNATFQDRPRPCKSSCKNPNCIRNEPFYSSGCQCNPLYLTSDEGKCILPDDCPGGNPCPQNETFVYCNARCGPTNYCPTDDNRAIIACSPPFPCPSGCACKANYKRLSYEDDRCILASECPPVTCTRENEEWNPCTPPCFTESCRDINEPPRECYGPDCQPQCVCKEGYLRNDSDICVPISNC